jgi:hypothetical protein
MKNLLIAVLLLVTTSSAYAGGGYCWSGYGRGAAAGGAASFSTITGNATDNTSLATSLSGKEPTLPLTTLGDTLYQGAGVRARLPGNITTTQNFLSQTGDGVNSMPPSWHVIPSAGSLTYYLQDTASAVSTYKKLLTSPYSPLTTEAFTPGAGTFVLQNFITESGFPNVQFLPAGQFEFHIHADQVSGTARVYAEFWEANSAGTDIALIGTSSQTPALTGANVEYRLFFTTANPYTMASAASRIVCRVWTITTGAPTVNLFVGGTSDSHITLPSNTVDATSFIPYTGAVLDVNLGSHNVTTTGSYTGLTTTQSPGDNSTKLASTAYADAGDAGKVNLAGTAGGQTINGDTLSGGNLTLSSTANATKGTINFGSLASITETTGDITVAKAIITNGITMTTGKSIAVANNGTFSINTGQYTGAGSITAVSMMTGTNTHSGGTTVDVAITPTLNQTSGAAHTALQIDVTETAVGSGAQKLVSMLAGVAGTTEMFAVSNKGQVTYGTVLFAALGTPANGTFAYCSDCTVTTPATCTTNLLTSCTCAGSGNGALAKRLNGTWYCN